LSELVVESIYRGGISQKSHNRTAQQKTTETHKPHSSAANSSQKDPIYKKQQPLTRPCNPKSQKSKHAFYSSGLNTLGINKTVE
jgi:hypothetical protein